MGQPTPNLEDECMATSALAPSVDPYEAERFARLAATWWDERGPFWPLHRLNALRVRFIADLLCARLGRDAAGPTPLAGLSAVDVGCGGGILSEGLARLGMEVVGIDVVERNIRIAREHAAQSGLAVDYRVTTAEALAELGAQFDVVFNMEVVEHVADLRHFMHACNNLVRPGGLMFVATINRTWPAFLAAILGAEYVLRWLPRGTHQWSKLRRPKEIEALLAEGGLLVTDVTGVRVDPLSRRFTLWGYTGINYMIVAERPALPANVADALARLSLDDRIVSLTAWARARRSSPSLDPG
jgi:2-polyprenyl-6-hydroxyphenyl methylase/3-demethylubiquinone-9 3-methyltransferase